MKVKFKSRIEADKLVLFFTVLTLFVSASALIFGKFFIGILYLLIFRVFLQFIVKVKIKPGDVVLFFGLPGSGKSLSLAKVGIDSQTAYKQFGKNIDFSKKFKHIAVNDNFITYTGADTFFNRQLLCERCWHDTLFLYDEASLDGFDSRNFQKNFKDENLLRLFKKVRHNGNAFVFANQGANELDSKIRDSLCNKVYYCEDYGSYSIASRLIKDITISEISGEIQQGFRKPSLFERIIYPRYTVILPHRRLGSLYSTKMPDHDLPEADYGTLRKPK